MNTNGTITSAVEISPIRDWSVDIAGKPYGLVQWNKGTCQAYVGKFVGHLPASPAVVAFGLVLCGVMLLFALTQGMAVLVRKGPNYR